MLINAKILLLVLNLSYNLKKYILVGRSLTSQDILPIDIFFQRNRSIIIYRHVSTDTHKNIYL